MDLELHCELCGDLLGMVKENVIVEERSKGKGRKQKTWHLDGIMVKTCCGVTKEYIVRDGNLETYVIGTRFLLRKIKKND